MVVGIISLIKPSQQQQNIAALSITPYDGYDNTTKMNDIALISVRLSHVFFSVQYPLVDFRFLVMRDCKVWL